MIHFAVVDVVKTDVVGQNAKPSESLLKEKTEQWSAFCALMVSVNNKSRLSWGCFWNSFVFTVPMNLTLFIIMFRISIQMVVQPSSLAISPSTEFHSSELQPFF